MANGDNNLNLNSLKKLEFDRAKKWYFWANSANVAIIIVGLIANIFPPFAPLAAALSLLLIIVSFVAQWVSDNAKNTAEWALRQFEMWDSLGWKVNKKDLRDILAKVPSTTRAEFHSPDAHKYFDSKAAISGKRLAENFMQSAFYTKYQAFYIAKVIFGVSAAVIFMIIFTMSVALQNTSVVDGTILSYILLTAIQLVLATGYLRLGIDYWQFGTEADSIENRACVLAESGNPEKVDAIRVAHDYQIARSKLPLIPGWVWNRIEHELNELWGKQYGESQENEN